MLFLVPSDGAQAYGEKTQKLFILFSAFVMLFLSIFRMDEAEDSYCPISGCFHERTNEPSFKRHNIINWWLIKAGYGRVTHRSSATL